MYALRLLPLVASVLVLSAQAPRPIGKPVMDIAPGHGSPEAAYAALARAYTEGCEHFAALFPTRLAGKLPKGAFKPRPEPLLSQYRKARLEEVLESASTAAVIATLGDGTIDLWFAAREEGRWVMLGNDQPGSLDAARKMAAAQAPALGAKAGKPSASATASSKISNPTAHLARFTQHLATKGQDPKVFLLEALARHPLVAFGEVHNRVASWDLLLRLVKEPAFAQRTGTIYLELPRHAQPLMDRFMASATLDVEPVREILRSLFHSGWPCQDEVDFLAAVWAVNQKLEPARRVRVRLVDQPWDWSEVQTKADLAKLESDRNPLMAEAILADLKARPDTRSALFQVGYLHLPCNLAKKVGGTVFQSAGQLLRTALGDRLFSVVQHSPVMGNRGGQLDGRVRKGLFDEAFAAHGNKPVAFALAGSPFGREPFDMAMDLRKLDGTFGSAFDGYLFLGPLEQDRYSAVAPGFYTEAYAQEVERRCQLQFGVGVKEVEGLEGSDGAAIEAGMTRWMGKPASWVDRLGPVDAWRK